jgi:hypothetical protein
MPPSTFNPLAAVIVHSQVPVNPLAFSLLEDEAALLIHSCPRRATRQEWIRYNRDGKMIVFVRHSPRLIYSITATVLDPTGENLGHFHPGRCLNDRSLAFLNGGRIPFQFDSASASRFILKDPSLDPEAGGTTEASFEIEHAFVDLDLETYPGGSAAGPSTPEMFTPLTAQAVVTTTVAARNGLLRAMFWRESPFAAGAMTLTLYNGLPSGSGIAVSDPLAAGSGWTAVTSGGNPHLATCRNAAALDFLDASGTDRTATHLAWHRAGVLIAELEFSTPQTILAYHGLRIPASAIGLQLTWAEAGSGMAEAALLYLFGLSDIDATAANFDIAAYSPAPSPALVVAGFVTIPRDTDWAISGATVSHTAVGNFTASDLAYAAPIGGGGWTVGSVRLYHAALNRCVLAPEFTPDITIAEGDFMSFPASALTLTLN